MPRGWFNIVWRLLNSISHPTIELKEKSTLYISSLYEHCYFTVSPATDFLSTPYLKYSRSRCPISSLKRWKHSFKPAGQAHIYMARSISFAPSARECSVETSFFVLWEATFDSCAGYHFVHHSKFFFSFALYLAVKKSKSRFVEDLMQFLFSK